MKPIPTSKRIVNMLMRLEGFRADSYRCPAGRWSLGFGETEGVTAGQHITREDAEGRLREDLDRIAQAIAPLIEPELTENAFSACVSLVYNIGIEAFTHSTLLRKINQGDMEGAANEFLRWCNVHGVPVRGLRRRRAIERGVFLSEDSG